LARRLPNPTQPRYTQPAWGQKCIEVSMTRGRRLVGGIGSGGKGGGGLGCAASCSHRTQCGLCVRPTVSLGVTSAVVSSCGHDSGQIEQRVAHELAGHWATHEGPAERPPHRHPPHAQPLAPVRQPQGRRPRLTPRGCTDQTPPSDEGQPCGRLREEQRHHRSLVPREAMPGRRSSFRLLHHHTLFFC
jgi:hypothetical protein